MITIELDKIRHIRLTPNAITDAEATRKMGLIAMLYPTNVGVTSIRALLWAGLRHEDPSLTPEKVGDLMEAYLQRHSFQSLEKIVIDALNESGCFRVIQPQKEADTPNRGKRKRN